MKYVLLYGLALVAVYDLITTIVGTVSILGENAVQIGVSVLFGAIISAFLFYSYEIHHMNKDGMPKAMLGLLWFFALIYDLWTSFTGNILFIIQTNGSIIIKDIDKGLVLIGLTLFVSSSTIIISYLLNSSFFLSSR